MNRSRKEWKRMKRMKFREIRTNEMINTYIRQADVALSELGYTEHSFPHVTSVAEKAGYILQTMGYEDRLIELAKIAGYLHDIGNVYRLCLSDNPFHITNLTAKIVIITELSLSLQSYLTIVVFRHDSTIRVRYNIFAVIMAIRVIRAAMPASALENGRFSTSNSTNTNKVILFSFREK